MADFTLTLDPNWVDGVMEEAEEGLTEIARAVAASARRNAPRSKRDRYASVRAVVARTTRSIPEDIDVTDYVVKAMKAQRDVQVNRMSALRSSVPVTGIRPPGTITGRELGKDRPYGVAPNQVLNIEGRTMGKKGEEIAYPIEHAELTKGTKKNPSRLVTGRHLADSITVDVESTGRESLEATILADRPYAWFVEKAMGPGGDKGERSKGRGFMERALAAHAADIESGNILKR